MCIYIYIYMYIYIYIYYVSLSCCETSQQSFVAPELGGAARHKIGPQRREIAGEGADIIIIAK